VPSDPADWLCDGANCRYAHDGRALYRDAGHLNVRGALYLLPKLRADLAKVTAASGDTVVRPVATEHRPHEIKGRHPLTSER